MSTKVSDHDPVNCIWMDAGVVGYKLCDRSLQCDHCPFDESMRQPSQGVSADVSSSPRSQNGGMPTGSITDRITALV
ncbi:MAG TPA: hypothetical protein VJB38_07150, partial [Bacteroidota bacterium]|nr:hypothetical protein [Bacteroidota bacterium]